MKFTACQPSVPDPALLGNSSSFSLTYQTLTCWTWLVKVRRDCNFIQMVISEQFIQQGDQLCLIPSPFPLPLHWTDLPGEGNPESGGIWSQWPEMKSAGSWKWSQIHPVCSAVIEWCYESQGSLPGDKYPPHSYLFTCSGGDAHETIMCKMMGKQKQGMFHSGAVPWQTHGMFHSGPCDRTLNLQNMASSATAWRQHVIH